MTLDVDLPKSLLSGYMKRLLYVGCRTSSQLSLVFKPCQGCEGRDA